MTDESKTTINGYDFTNALKVTKEILDGEKEKEFEQIKKEFEQFTRIFPLKDRDEYYNRVLHGIYNYNNTALLVLAAMYNVHYINIAKNSGGYYYTQFGPQKYILVEKYQRTDPIITRSVSAETSVIPRADNVDVRD
jgi:hypothetical protein